MGVYVSASDIATYIAIALPVGAFTTWVLRHYLAELKPNGGESIKDKVDKLDQKVDKLEARIDDIYALLVNKGSRKRSQ